MRAQFGLNIGHYIQGENWVATYRRRGRRLLSGYFCHTVVALDKVSCWADDVGESDIAGEFHRNAADRALALTEGRQRTKTTLGYYVVFTTSRGVDDEGYHMGGRGRLGWVLHERV